MPTLKHKASTFRDNQLVAAEYFLATEEPLRIHINEKPFAVVMRLPGDDLHLVTGLCFTRGIIDSWDDLVSVQQRDTVREGAEAFVRLRENRRDAFLLETEGSYSGKLVRGVYEMPEARESLAKVQPVPAPGLNCIHLDEIFGLKAIFEAGQQLFLETGCTHAASIFGKKGELVAFSEDVSRHNAFDKAIGSMVRLATIQRAFLAIVSSRIDYETVCKASRLGVEVLSGMSGPTGKAVHIAQKLNITLIGFLRESSLSIYTCPERILVS